MQTYLQRIGRFEIVAFTTGFALMAYELVAARLLAPSIGSSVYVWTSVIGVMIAALSIGYAIGGKIADVRVRGADIAWLLLFSAFSIVITVLLATYVLEAVAHTFSDARLQGVVASLVLFAPTSFLLGIVSPYLVRLRIVSATTSGESVALLSALNSLGGISGTFLTGFIFFSFVGTAQALVIIAGLLLAMSWLIMPRVRWRQRVVVTAVLVASGGVALFPPALKGVLATIDTSAATYQVQTGKAGGGAVKLLVAGPSGYQSGVYSDGRPDLVFFYTKKIAQVVAQTPQKTRILVLGGGAFTLPQYFGLKYPHSHVDVVEIDPQLRAIASQYFNYTSPPNVRVIAQDARAFLNANHQRYDVIIVDVYSDISIPFTLATREYAAVLKRALMPDGVVVANFVAGVHEACKPLFEGLNAAYRSVFSASVFYPQIDVSLQQRQNVIAVYGEGVMPWLSRSGTTRAHIAQSVSFTDNAAPVELLNQRCQQ